MQLIRKNGATSNIIRRVLRHATTGQGLTGLDHTSSGLIISTICDNEGTAVAYTVAGSTIEAVSTIGTYSAPTATKCRFKAVDATNHPGLYELQFADARFAVSNAKTLRISISGATNLLMVDFVVQLTSVDVDDVVRLGLTALPNVASGNAGALIVAGTGTAALSVTSGVAQADVKSISGDSTAADNAESFFDGTGYAGTNNVIPTVTTVTNQLTAAQIATGVWQDTTAGDFTVASSIGKSLYTSGVVPGGSGGLFISGSNSGTTTFGALTVTGATTLTGIVTATNGSNSIIGCGVTTTSINAIADQVWDEVLSGHAGAGSAGAALTAAGSAGDPWATALPGAYGAGTAGLIVGTTIQNAVAATAIRAAVGLASANLDTQLSAIAGYIDTEIGTIVTATSAASIRAAVGLASANLDTQLAAIAGYIDTEIGTIVTQTGAAAIRAAVGLASADLDTQLAAIVSDTNELQTDWTNGGRLDLIIDAILDDTGTSGVVVASGSKTGYALSATGLDLIVPADPSTIPVLGTASIVAWIGYFGAWTVNEVNSDSNSVDLRNSADNANLATHATSDDGSMFTSAEPT